MRIVIDSSTQKISRNRKQQKAKNYIFFFRASTDSPRIVHEENVLHAIKSRKFVKIMNGNMQL